MERGFYGEQIERLFSIFPREQVLILTADGLREQPGESLWQVADFLGIARAGAVEHRDVHVGREVGAQLAAEDADYLRGLYARDMAWLTSLTGVSFW